MGGLTQRLLPLVDQAHGRCHSCAHQQVYDLPNRTIYYCRAYDSEYDSETRDQVRDCSRWLPFRGADGHSRNLRALGNPLFSRLIEAEDQLFWQLQVRLCEVGVDLKTVLVLAQPSIRSADEVAWIDGLENRFGDAVLAPNVASLEEIIAELRALRYDSVCEVLQGISDKASMGFASPICV
jgi:hypothetical protein